MRKILLTTAAIAALGGAIGAQAAPGQPNSIGGSVAEQLSLVEQAQFTYEGRRHCWYARGWHGPGWYWCGYAGRRGHGWGGPEGWNGWHRR